MKKEEILIAGVMSGTSLDGIDVALVRVAESGPRPAYTLHAFHCVPYAPELKETLLRACRGNLTMRALLALDVDLGHAYAAAIADALEIAGVDPATLDVVGLHGQTVWHEPRRRPHGVTAQIGSGAVVAEELGCPVVNDFRSADVAAGGEGAPLVPFCDLMLLASSETNRVALNIGGIANITWLPVGATADNLRAFDTGPGNALIDAAMRELRGQDYDADGALAALGRPDLSLLEGLAGDPWFAEPPPKSTGRERFGEEEGRAVARRCREEGAADADIIATLTRFTAQTIANGIRDFAAGDTPVHEIIVSGGGAHNRTLLGFLREEFPDATVGPCDDYGISVDAKEAFCFALLAHATLRGVPNNVPSVTGARHAVVGGAIRGFFNRD